MRLKSRHFLTGTELSHQELQELLELSALLKRDRLKCIYKNALSRQHLALLFNKPSLRTRLSFSIAMQELGGNTFESLASNRKYETPEDTIRVLEGYVHGVLLRTHAHGELEKMAAIAQIPIINGLSDLHHPCQTLADLLTVQESHGTLKGITLAYVGDGNNILHSLLLLGPFLGMHVRYSCPPGYQPDPTILAQAELRAIEGGGSIQSQSTPTEAARSAQALYTDVWTSMGFEAENAAREKAFAGYQLNSALYSHAAPGAIVLHCLPMERGKEITDAMADHPRSAIFRQSENRLHTQKALLVALMGNEK